MMKSYQTLMSEITRVSTRSSAGIDDVKAAFKAKKISWEQAHAKLLKHGLSVDDINKHLNESEDYDEHRVISKIKSIKGAKYYHEYGEEDNHHDVEGHSADDEAKLRHHFNQHFEKAMSPSYKKEHLYKLGTQRIHLKRTDAGDAAYERRASNAAHASWLRGGSQSNYRSRG